MAQAYKGEEVLIVYDPDFEHGQNFYTFTTEVVKLEYLESLKVVEVAAEAAAAEGGGAAGEGGDAEPDSDDEMDDKPERREGPWVSLGSEIEIQETMLPPAMPRAQITITRRRRYFGSPLTFANTERPTAEEIEAAGPDSESLKLTSVEFKSHEPIEDAPPPLHRTLLDSEVTAIPVTQTTGSQTTWPKPRNMWTQYTPRTEGDESTSKVLKATSTATHAPPRRQSVMSAGSAKPEDEGEPVDPVLAFLEKVFPDVAHALQENEIIDLFTDDFRLLKGIGEAPVSYRSEGNDVSVAFACTMRLFDARSVSHTS